MLYSVVPQGCWMAELTRWLRVRIPAQMRDRLLYRASVQRRDISWLVRDALEAYMEGWEPSEQDMRGESESVRALERWRRS